MRIISFNVNGIRASATKGLLDSIRTMAPDVIGFQETKANPEQVNEVLAPLQGYEIYAYSAQKAGYSGTAIATKIKPIAVTFGIGQEEHDTQGRVITAEFQSIFVVNVYVPNSGSELARLGYRQEWDKALLTYIKELEKRKPVVFCGDLNVAHRPIDLKNDKSNYNKTAGYMQEEIDGMDRYVGAGLVDSFRALHPNEIKYSWWSFRMNARASNVGWRIDYMLVSSSLLSKISSAFILNDVHGSDHCPVGIDIDV